MQGDRVIIPHGPEGRLCSKGHDDWTQPALVRSNSHPRCFTCNQIRNKNRRRSVAPWAPKRFNVPLVGKSGIEWDTLTLGEFRKMRYGDEAA